MTKVLACIDGSIYSASVISHARWAALGLGASVDILQVLGRREAAALDRSGRIVAGARKQLLTKLTELDAERSKLLQEQAWLDLKEAAIVMQEAGVAKVQTFLRQGDLLDEFVEREAGNDLLVLGKRGEAANFATMHLGSNIERLLRSATIPVLVAARKFEAIERVVLAFDGRPSALKAVAQMAASPLFGGMEVAVIGAGEASTRFGDQIDNAVARLNAAGMRATGAFEPGPPISVIPKAVEAQGANLLVMGAYGHSRLRTLVIGSTTSEMIRSCLIPIMVFR